MRIAVLDIETTGRDPRLGTIVEIGIVMIDLRNQFKTKLFDSVVQDDLFQVKFEAPRLEKCWIFENSDLTISEVLNAPKITEILPKLQRILNKFPVTAYNKQFDFNFLKKQGLHIPMELPCPMIAATPILKIPPRYEMTEYKWPSVQECWDYFFPNSPYYLETHRAYDDAEHEAEIVYRLYEMGAWKPIF